MQLFSPCKINLVLNILGRRPDGFHELETIMIPVPYCDVIDLAQYENGFLLTCSDPTLAVDKTNLVFRAADAFFNATGLKAEVSIHLTKRIPMAAGLGGGSGNAALTLRGLNNWYKQPLDEPALHRLAASLGSDIPFFLQDRPALATGRGESVESLAPFDCLKGKGLLLIHPGFGISTPWSYGQLARFPHALNGSKGRAMECASLIQSGNLKDGLKAMYNSLEAPALEKYPILSLYQEFLRSNGAIGALMSGSGSATFGVFESVSQAREILPRFETRFGSCWTAVVEL